MTQKKAHILYVEDDDYLAFVTRDNLEMRGYQVTHCSDGKTAKDSAVSSGYDLCLLDIMLPELDGFELAKAIRKLDEDIPILFISAKSMKEDKLKGFMTGADDYITKPYNIEELIMRIEVFLRRSRVRHHGVDPSAVTSIGAYRFDPAALSLSLEDNECRLTEREAALLGYLCKRANQVVRRNEILEQVWNDDNYFSGRSLDVFISRLRKYLSADETVSLDNVHGVGFMLKAKVNSL
jgi:DNA-binding response OmpR family regulator